MVMWTSTHCFDFFSCNLIDVYFLNTLPPKQKSWLHRCCSPLNSSSLFVSDDYNIIGKNKTGGAKKILNMNGERQFRKRIFLLIYSDYFINSSITRMQRI